MYDIYILHSVSKDVYYKGFSENVEKRLEYHLNTKGKYTSDVSDWKIVYIKEFETKKEALIEEKRLKKL
ncbi:MAG TPA: GIY-YIG nuclease family protein, partial [Chryseobacterium sp.]